MVLSKLLAALLPNHSFGCRPKDIYDHNCLCGLREDKLKPISSFFIKFLAGMDAIA